MECGSEEWALGNEGPRHVVLHQHFELTEDELKWLQACADARGVELVDELKKRVCLSDDFGPELDNFWDGNRYRSAAEVMNAALEPFSAGWPAPKPFRVYEDVPFGQDGRAPVDEDEWRLAADRWRTHLAPGGLEHFNKALECALVFDGKGAAANITLASKYVLETP